MKLETGCGHLRIQEIDKLLSFISPDFAVIDSNAVCGKLHLIQAANLSLSAHGGNSVSYTHLTLPTILLV